ncbi:hypothetical protein BKA93DRAFT_754686 [Sparassis latifolia]
MGLVHGPLVLWDISQLRRFSHGPPLHYYWLKGIRGDSGPPIVWSYATCPLLTVHSRTICVIAGLHERLVGVGVIAGLIERLVGVGVIAGLIEQLVGVGVIAGLIEQLVGVGVIAGFSAKSSQGLYLVWWTSCLTEHGLPKNGHPKVPTRSVLGETDLPPHIKWTSQGPYWVRRTSRLISNGHPKVPTG